jgi:hypothetical protein
VPSPVCCHFAHHSNHNHWRAKTRTLSTNCSLVNATTTTMSRNNEVVVDDEQPTTMVREDIDEPKKLSTLWRTNNSVGLVRSACCYGILGMVFVAAFLGAGFALSYYRNHHNHNDISANSMVASPARTDEEYASRYRLFRSYAEQILSDELALWQSNTPQAQALDWLVYQDRYLSQDTAIFDPLLLSRFTVRYALLVLYYACGGTTTTTTATTTTTTPGGGGLASWWLLDPAQATCDWSFVTCDDDDETQNGGHADAVVVALELHDVLIGQLPAELALLSTLTRLDLSHNALEGTIPAAVFAGLTNLGTWAVFLRRKRGRNDTFRHTMLLTLYISLFVHVCFSV